MSFRIEEKFTIKKSRLFEFKNYLFSKNAKTLFHKRKIKSLYFDNDNYKMYNESIEGSLPRKKIRIRNYLDKNFFLEIKISSVEGRFKKSNLISKEKFDMIKKLVYLMKCMDTVNLFYLLNMKGNILNLKILELLLIIISIIFHFKKSF